MQRQKNIDMITKKTLDDQFYGSLGADKHRYYTSRGQSAFDELLEKIGIYQSNDRDKRDTEAMYIHLTRAFDVELTKEEALGALAEALLGNNTYGYVCNFHELLIKAIFTKAILQAVGEHGDIVTVHDFNIDVGTGSDDYCLRACGIPVYNKAGLEGAIQDKLDRVEDEFRRKEEEEALIMSSQVTETSLIGYGLSSDAILSILLYCEQFGIKLTNGEVKNEVSHWFVLDTKAINKTVTDYFFNKLIDFLNSESKINKYFLTYKYDKEQQRYRLLFRMQQKGEMVEILTKRQLLDAIEYYNLFKQGKVE